LTRQNSGFVVLFGRKIAPGGAVPIAGSVRPRHVLRETSTETNFPLPEIEFTGGRNGPETQGCNPAQVINNGVGSMSIILRLIYREYCRACLGHLKYF
jgi:hypothetical protein